MQKKLYRPKWGLIENNKLRIKLYKFLKRKIYKVSEGEIIPKSLFYIKAILFPMQYFAYKKYILEGYQETKQSDVIPDLEYRAGICNLGNCEICGVLIDGNMIRFIEINGKPFRVCRICACKIEVGKPMESEC